MKLVSAYFMDEASFTLQLKQRFVLMKKNSADFMDEVAS